MTHYTRLIPLEGVRNFRDMGGYITKDGRNIRWGRLFRSGHLCSLTDTCGLEMLARDIETVIDFRSKREASKQPPRWPSAWVPDYHSVPIGGNAAAWVQEMYTRLKTSDVPAADLKEQLLDAFRTIPIVNRDSLKGFFDILLGDLKGNAVLFHCAAGKDRTGIAAALFMKALEIEDDQILEDFLLTNTAVDLDHVAAETAERLSARSGRSLTPADVRPLVGVEADFLHTAFRAIERAYGDMDTYLVEEMGLTDQKRAKLKDLFLTE